MVVFVSSHEEYFLFVRCIFLQTVVNETEGSNPPFLKENQPLWQYAGFKSKEDAVSAYEQILNEVEHSPKVKKKLLNGDWYLEWNKEVLVPRNRNDRWYNLKALLVKYWLLLVALVVAAILTPFFFMPQFMLTLTKSVFFGFVAGIIFCCAVLFCFQFLFKSVTFEKDKQGKKVARHVEPKVCIPWLARTVVYLAITGGLCFGILEGYCTFTGKEIRIDLSNRDQPFSIN